MTSFWNSPAWSMGKRSSNTHGSKQQPGPGEYSSATNIGKYKPSHKIGNALRDSKKGDNNPGPGNYNIVSGHSGPKITMNAKPKTGSLAQYLMPGPGNYDVNQGSVYKNPSAFTMGIRYDSHKQEQQPGPGAYNTAGDLKQRGPKIGKAQRNNLGPDNNQPGPGQYFNARPASAGPKYGFGHEVKSMANLDFRPGPGQYEVNAESTLKIKGCIIGQKNNKTSGISLGPGPGSYDTISKRPQSGTKIGKAQRTSYGAGSGPGPGAYDSLYRGKTANQCKIGTSKRGQFAKEDTPGPGSYDYAKNKMKGVTISGSKPRFGMDPTPGPGEYEIEEDATKRPCSAKIGKSQRSGYGVVDTPGPGQYYPKDKRDYHFAYNKQVRSKDLKGGDPGPGQYQIPKTVPSAPHYALDAIYYKSYH